MKRICADPEYQAKAREWTRLSWTTPERRVNFTESMRRLWSDPEFRARQSKSHKLATSTQVYRSKRSVLSKSMWADSEFRARRAESLQRAMDRPEYKVKISESSKRKWSDPASRGRTMKAMKDHYQKANIEKESAMPLEERKAIAAKVYAWVKGKKGRLAISAAHLGTGVGHLSRWLRMAKHCGRPYDPCLERWLALQEFARKIPL